MGYTSFETAFRTGDFSDNRRRLLDWKNENTTIDIFLKIRYNNRKEAHWKGGNE